ncbi:uncharacterized protein LOC142339022 isoform X1 [Convolutriloba macropyga]|uniref:uncharacterized protein LOC142339022 isoform X1 n=1 Tax=Convolutriloba macropyga TaxID=536237 RepID=UPI003F520F42
MRVLALVSGGKDSTYGIVECMRQGHDIVCLGNMAPTPGIDELDSFMYQTVGHHAIDTLAEAMQLPMIRRTITNKCTQGHKVYKPRETDEVEDMFELVKDAKEKYDIEAVTSGAIASTYQRTRVESICARLSLVSFAYLWNRDQIDLLAEMAESGINSILIKISGIGLTIEKHLGGNLQHVTPDLIKFHRKFGINPCGEGGEFETFTLDAPCFKCKIAIDSDQIIEVDLNDVCPVAYMNILKTHCEPKESNQEIVKLDRSNFYQLPELGNLLRNSEFLLEAPRLNQNGTPSKLSPGAMNEFERATRVGNVCFCAIARTIDVDNDPVTLGIFERQLSKCDELLQQVGSSLDRSFCVYLYIPRMAQFAELNKIYEKFFRNCTCPPARSCVEASPSDVICVYAVAKWIEASSNDRRLYVRSISHWAPANIGPYSQYVSFEGVAFVSGQIPMIPATLNILDSREFVHHATLSLHHVKAVLRELNSKFSFNPYDNEDYYSEIEAEQCVLFCVCYVTSSHYFSTVRHIWSHLQLPSQNLIILQVPCLPKKACIEWEFVCIEPDLEPKFTVVMEVLDNASKFLESALDDESIMKPCRVFMEKQFITDNENIDNLNKLVQTSAVCLVPVDKVYNGSVAVCSYEQIEH